MKNRAANEINGQLSIPFLLMSMESSYPVAKNFFPLGFSFGDNRSS